MGVAARIWTFNIVVGSIATILMASEASAGKTREILPAYNNCLDSKCLLDNELYAKIEDFDSLLKNREHNYLVVPPKVLGVSGRNIYPGKINPRYHRKMMFR